MMNAGRQQQNGKVVSPLYRVYHGQPRPLTTGMLTRMNIPKRYWKASLDRVTDAIFKQHIVGYLVGIKEALDKGIGMILNGQQGTGKTAIGALCLKQARRIGATGYFITADQYIRSNIQRIPFDDTVMIIGRCRDVDLLVLDDMSREAVNLSSSGDSVAAMFEALIKDRCSDGKSTIITTNLNMHDFSEIYGESMFGMLTGSSATVHVTVGSQREKEVTEVERFFNIGEGSSRRETPVEKNGSVDGVPSNPFTRKGR